MKKLLVPLAVIALLALAVPSAFATSEWELGIGWTPSTNPDSADPGVVSSLISYHVGYSWNVLYVSWDAYAIPDYMVYNLTSYVDAASGYYVPGYYVPGFMNLFDVGLKFYLRPVLGYVEVGTNALYLYGGSMYSGGLGVNARMGIGLKFGWWGINLSATDVFANWNDLGYAFGQAFGGNFGPLGDGALLSFNVALYF
jgi:hypothetical protein